MMHDLLIAKLQAYGFDNDNEYGFNFICNYLVDREQRIKINSHAEFYILTFSTWSKIENGVDQYWGLYFSI